MTGVTWGGSSLIFECEFGTNEFGDFFAGWFSPLAFGWFVFTVYMQKKELSQTNDIAKQQATSLKKQVDAQGKQTFENTFFGLVNSFMNIIDSMTLTEINNSKIEPKRGRIAIQHIADEILQDLKRHPLFEYPGLASEGGLNSKEGFSEYYNKLYSQKNSQCLSHYFRMMNRIFKFIDKNGYFNIKAKKRYANFLRAHLSDKELLLLLFNTLTEKGKPMLFFVIKYDLFDNFPVEELPNGKDYLNDHLDKMLKKSGEVKIRIAEQNKDNLRDKNFLQSINQIAKSFKKN